MQRFGENRTVLHWRSRVGGKKPGAELVLKIADFFGVPVETLMRDELNLDTDDNPL
jgi:hypothetical protein